eukprot:gene26865-4471_t
MAVINTDLSDKDTVNMAVIKTDLSDKDTVNKAVTSTDQHSPSRIPEDTSSNPTSPTVLAP